MFKNWMVFFNERFPLIPNIIMAMGLTSSGYSLYNLEIEWPIYIYVFFVLFFFVAQLRFMDELKDFEKDKVAHPERPLPRGLISTKDMGQVIFVTQLILFIFAILAFVFSSMMSGLFLLIGVVWLYLMYKEFFIGASLSKSPLLYAITHQVIIIPMGLFATSAISHSGSFDSSAVWFSLMILSVFFTFEVSRKMDPDALPILATYLWRYGKVKTVSIVLCLSVLGAAMSLKLNLLSWVLPAMIIMLLTHVLAFTHPKKFKLIEAAVIIYLLYIVWLLPIRGIFV